MQTNRFFKFAKIAKSFLCQGWEIISTEFMEKGWKDKYSEWSKQPKCKEHKFENLIITLHS